MNPDELDVVYPPAIRAAIGELVEEVGPPCSGEAVTADPSLMADVELLFAGWGVAPLTSAVLAAAPNLRAVFYAAGSTKCLMTDAAWDRGLTLTSAVQANALPVAEFTQAQVVMCLKRVWQHALGLAQTRRWEKGEPGATGYNATVGLVSLGNIGTRVAETLAGMDVHLLAYDIKEDADLAARTGLGYASLEEIFRRCDVVSLHTPLLPETRGVIGASLLRSMKPDASLINTARGGLIDHTALCRVLRDRPDLLAVLDVVDPEPPASDHPLWSLPNAVLTPHISGSQGAECGRMGQWMYEELRRYLAGEPLRWQVHRDGVAVSA